MHRVTADADHKQTCAYDLLQTQLNSSAASMWASIMVLLVAALDAMANPTE